MILLKFENQKCEGYSTQFPQRETRRERAEFRKLLKFANGTA
jgi:hypothetical protein